MLINNNYDFEIIIAVYEHETCVSCSGERWAAQLEQEALAVLDATDTLEQTPDDVADAESTFEVLSELRAHVQTCVCEALAAQSQSQTTPTSTSTSTAAASAPQAPPPAAHPPSPIAAAASTDARSSPPARVVSPPHGGAARNFLRSAVESKRLYVRPFKFCCTSYLLCLEWYNIYSYL